MQNKSLIKDYIERAQVRIGSVEYLYSKKAWADTVMESQEIVELALKSLLVTVILISPAYTMSQLF